MFQFYCIKTQKEILTKWSKLESVEKHHGTYHQWLNQLYLNQQKRQYRLFQLVLILEVIHRSEPYWKSPQIL